MEVSLEDAYGEACKALGEAVVRERLLLAELGKRDGQIRVLAEQVGGNPPTPPTE